MAPFKLNQFQLPYLNRLLTTITIIVYWLNRNGVRADDNNIFLYNSIDHCKFNEYFDVNYFVCKPCDANLFLVRAINGLSCVCNDHSTVDVAYDNVLKSPICRPNDCTTSPTTSCITAPESHTCTLKYIREAAGNLQARSIQIYHKPEPPQNQSDAMNHTIATIKSPCSRACDDNRIYIQYQNYCIPRVLMKDFLSFDQFQQPQYHQVDTMSNAYAGMEFLLFFCHTMKIGNACEHLANLCVLSMYSSDRYSPCNLFFSTQSTIMTSGDGGAFYQKPVPYLYLTKGKSSLDELEKVIDYRYGYDREDYVERSRHIQLILVAFNLDGQLQIIKPFQLNDLNLCNGQTFQAKHVVFGKSVKESCRIDLKSLIDFGETRPWFYNLYLNYTENNVNLLKTVPILIRNSASLNANPYDSENWQLVRRFFIIDIFSSLNQSYRSQFYSNENRPEKFISIKYLRRAEFVFKLHSDHRQHGNKIAVPLLILDYGDVKRPDNYSTWEGGFHFQITFSKKISLTTLLDILLPTFLITAFAIALFQTYVYRKRNQSLFYDTAMILKFMVFLSSNVANAIFVIASLLTLYLFFEFKHQKTLKVVAPFPEEHLIEFFFVFAFILKGIKVGQHFWQQIHCDIFFIDWERPRVFEHQISLKTVSGGLDTPSITSSSKNFPQCDGVSAWRTYFVANEWVKLSTTRKCSMLFQLVSVSGIILFLVLKHVEAVDSALGPDPVQALAIGLIVYLTCYICQRLFHLTICTWYIKNSMQQFIDICSMSNISVFIFCLNSFGFYIHGRSPHGFADTDMCSMLLQLRREGDNMCGHRGLLPNSEHQSFCFLAPLQLRVLYDKLKSSLQKPNAQTLLQNYPENAIESNGGSRFEQNLQQMAQAQITINRFLSAFIDHGLKDLDYVIQEKSIFETCFNFEFESIVTENRGTFYLDNGHSFDYVLFYGNEALLFELEIMLFQTLIVFTRHHLFSMFVVAVVYKLLKALMEYFVKQNFSKQTLIDRRFLM